MAAHPRSSPLARMPVACAILAALASCGEVPPGHGPQAKSTSTQTASDQELLLNLYAGASPPSRRTTEPSKYPPLPQLEIAAADAAAVLQPSDRAEEGGTVADAMSETTAEPTPGVLNLVHQARIGEFAQGKQVSACAQGDDVNHARNSMPSLAFETKVVAPQAAAIAAAPIAGRQPTPPPAAAISNALEELASSLAQEPAPPPEAEARSVKSVSASEQSPEAASEPTNVEIMPPPARAWKIPTDPETAIQEPMPIAETPIDRFAEATPTTPPGPDSTRSLVNPTPAPAKPALPIQPAPSMDPPTPANASPKRTITVLSPPPPVLLPSTSVARIAAAGSPLLTPLLVMLAGCAVATLFIAWRSARASSAHPAARLRMTLRARFTLSCGGSATCLLALCWAAVWEMSISPAYPGALAAQVQLVALALASATIVIGSGVWLFRSVAQPVDQVLAQVRSISAGNLLSGPINSAAMDEVGELARATDKLAAYVKDALTEVAISTVEVEGAARQVVEGTSDASRALGTVAERCAAVAAQAAGTDNAESSSRSALTAATHLREAEQTVCAGVHSVRAIAEQGRTLQTLLEAINDLSARTRTVAVNASIESAKPGVSGRAFAGVAQEVQRLAERARLVADRAAQTVKSIETNAVGVDQRLAKGVQEITHGAQLAGKAGEEIVRISRQAGSAAEAIRVLGSTVEEVGAGASQSASIASQLSVRADELKATIGRFKLDTDGIMSRHRPPLQRRVETSAAAQ